MKKVLILCASPRKESNTMQVLKECARTITENGLEAEIVSLRQMKIRSCIACGKCSEIHQCALKDGLNDIIEKLKISDGFIIGSPVYFGTARGS